MGGNTWFFEQKEKESQRRGEEFWSEKLSRVGKLISNSIRETEKSGMIEKGAHRQRHKATILLFPHIFLGF